MTSDRAARLKRYWIAAVKRTAKIVVTIAVLVPVSAMYDSVKLFNELVPAFVNSDVTHRLPDVIQHVSRIYVSRNDYNTLFAGKSPLDAQRLGDVLETIAGQHPAAILVDIDSSDKSFEALRRRSAKWNVIWARTALYSKADDLYWPGGVLGRPIACGVDNGIAALTGLDRDGIVRRYTRYIRTNDGPMPSVSWAAIAKAGLSPKVANGAKASVTESRLIRFDSRFDARTPPAYYYSDVSRLLALKDSRPPAVGGTIVVLGGRYDTSDEFETPVGPMFGMDIVAQVIETEIEGGGRGPASALTMSVVALTAAMLLWFVVSRFRDRRLLTSLGVGLLTVFALAPVCSLITAAVVSTRLVFWFFCILIAVLINQVWNQLTEEKHAK